MQGTITVDNPLSKPVPVTLVGDTVTLSIDTTGLATTAKQDVGNASLTSLDGKTPALGQAAMAASSPVVLPSNDPFVLANRPLASIATPARIIGNGAAQQLPNLPCVSGCFVQVVGLTTAGVAVSATEANIGDSNVSNTRGFEIAVGSSQLFPVSNANALWFFGAATCTIQITVV
jgi:hypothetical protein